MGEGSFTPEIEVRDPVMVGLENVVGKIAKHLDKEKPDWNSKLKNGKPENYEEFLKQLGQLLIVRPGVGSDSLEDQLNFYNVFLNNEIKQKQLEENLEEVGRKFKAGGFSSSQEKAPEVDGISDKVDCVSATFILAAILKDSGIESSLYFLGDPTHPRLIVEIEGKNYDISANAPKVSSDILGTDFSMREMSEQHLNMGKIARENYKEISEWEGWPMNFNEKTLKGWEKYRDLIEKGMEPAKVQIGNSEPGVTFTRRKQIMEA